MEQRELGCGGGGIGCCQTEDPLRMDPGKRTGLGPPVCNEKEPTEAEEEGGGGTEGGGGAARVGKIGCGCGALRWRERGRKGGRGVKGGDLPV